MVVKQQAIPAVAGCERLPHTGQENIVRDIV